MWTREGVFLYPPRPLWTLTDKKVIAAAWKALPRKSAVDFPGLYIHFPSEIGALAEFYAPRKTHPYLDCLEKEAELLRLPRDLPLKTLYLGAGGTGAMTHLRASDIRRLMTWLKKRFALGELSQAVAEVDASALTAEKVRILARHGINRVTACLPPAGGPKGLRRRRDFAKGIRMCRAQGIRCVAVDMSAGRPGQAAAAVSADVDFVLGLKPDAVLLSDAASFSGPPARMDRLLKRIERGCSSEGPRSAANNLQLFHATEFNASILGLGWGAVSRVRGRLVYAPSGSCFEHVDSLLGGGKPRYHGGRLNADSETRTHIIRSLEDNGRIDRATFRGAFARNPEEAYPKEFALLIRERKLELRSDQLYVSSPAQNARYICSVRFYGQELLRRLIVLGTRSRSGRSKPGLSG